MADQTSPNSQALGTFLGALYALATSVGVPVPVALMALLGALVAAGNADKLQWSLPSILQVVTTLAVSLALGLYCAPFCGHLIMGPILRASGTENVPASAADPIAALVIAMYGYREFLPLVKGLLLQRLGGEKKEG